MGDRGIHLYQWSTNHILPTATIAELTIASHPRRSPKKCVLEPGYKALRLLIQVLTHNENGGIKLGIHRFLWVLLPLKSCEYGIDPQSRLFGCKWVLGSDLAHG